MYQSENFLPFFYRVQRTIFTETSTAFSHNLDLPFCLFVRRNLLPLTFPFTNLFINLQMSIHELNYYRNNNNNSTNEKPD